MCNFLIYFFRWFLLLLIPALLISLSFTSASAGSLDEKTDYTPLVALISKDSLEGPLYPFADFHPDFDLQNHRANLTYFKNNPQIISKIRKDLNGGRITWKLEEQKQRLLFVPESRDQYERLYESYCKELVGYILKQTHLKNPYKKIVTLHDEKPEIPSDGVTVFLIHNLAKESVARYVFSSDISDKTSEMQLRETDFIGRVGSFATNIYPKKDGTYEFVRDTFTLWQNNAKNPYTALMVPAEETLHILLREYTEQAIRKDLQQIDTADLKEIQSTADKWLAVEEAIVGGVVRAIVPPFIEKISHDISPEDITSDLDTKKKYEKYCYLCQGIELVEDIGIQKAISLYAKDPVTVKITLADYTSNESNLSTVKVKTN